MALGDVTGHGVAAALVMAGVRAVLRDRAVAAGDLAELMGRLNNFIAADYGGDRFMTMHLSVIDATTQTMRWVSAGHDPVIVYDPAEGTFAEVGEGEMPLDRSRPDVFSFRDRQVERRFRGGDALGQELRPVLSSEEGDHVVLDVPLGREHRVLIRDE